MAERPGSVLLGAFIVGALLVAVVGALFFAGGGFGGERSRVVMVFDGSLRGLTVGAPVALRGVTIGQVADIELILDADVGEVTMAVVAEIRQNNMQLQGKVTESITEELVARGLRAQLDIQSLLTGLLYVQLDFLPESEPVITPFDSPYPQIPTIPTELELLRQSLQSVDFAGFAEKLDRIGEGLDELLNSEEFRALPGELNHALVAVSSASESLELTLSENSPRLGTLLEEGTTTFASLNEELPQITAALGASLAKLDSAVDNADATLKNLQQASAPQSASRQQLGAAVQELSLAARSLRSLARSLEEQPQALLRGRSEESE